MAGRRSRADSTRPAVTLTASLEPGREGGGACAGGRSLSKLLRCSVDSELELLTAPADHVYCSAVAGRVVLQIDRRLHRATRQGATGCWNTTSVQTGCSGGRPQL